MAYKKRTVAPDSIIGGLLSGFGQVAEKSMENNYKVGQIQARGGLQEQLAQNNYNRNLSRDAQKEEMKSGASNKKNALEGQKREEQFEAKNFPNMYRPIRGTDKEFLDKDELESANQYHRDIEDEKKRRQQQRVKEDKKKLEPKGEGAKSDLW
jgi:hypothetical protein